MFFWTVPPGGGREGKKGRCEEREDGDFWKASEEEDGDERGLDFLGVHLNSTVVSLSQSSTQLRYSTAATCGLVLEEVTSPSLLPESKDPEVDISI
ncbi:hypothetical protein AVEN_248961-1 [Araneus ventricosus]|uniref:Uncharacterized protein n=1 Tax=Araneus ventricosus TaxID=182803 RepID=A0A4Y2J5X2_ARAVE|nr:hypothetical protein AVEN_248961-1 [Araneus ventricosus]